MKYCHKCGNAMEYDTNSEEYQRRKDYILYELENQRKRIWEDLGKTVVVTAFMWAMCIITESPLSFIFAILGILFSFTVGSYIFVDLPKNALNARRIENDKNVDQIEAALKIEKEHQCSGKAKL